MIVKQVPYLLGLVAGRAGFRWQCAGSAATPAVPGSVSRRSQRRSDRRHRQLRGAHLSRKDWLSLAVLGVGLIFLSVTAVPGTAARISLDMDWSFCCWQSFRRPSDSLASG